MNERFSPEVAQYEKEGYAIFRNVLDSGLVEEVQGHIDWLLEHNPSLRPEQALCVPTVTSRTVPAGCARAAENGTARPRKSIAYG